MKKRKKLRKEVYYVIIFIIILCIGIYIGINKYNDYLYKQTQEYKLLEVGYTTDEVNTILDNFDSDEYIQYYIDNYNTRLVELLNEEYYLEKNFYEYIDYMNNNILLSLSEVVRDINIHLNDEFYSTNYSTDTSKDYLMLVNKYYLLDEEYEPDDLVVISQDYSWGDYGSQMVREVAYEAFQEMWEAAYDQGYYLMVNSSYRSYSDQESVYNSYKASRGVTYADSIAARPGSSEHQTGLTLDIFSKSNPSKASFEGSDEANWLKENSYKYGFILRYPEDKTDITGYSYESWHFRYVGIEAATYIYEHNITFEEYYAYFVED